MTSLLRVLEVGTVAATIFFIFFLPATSPGDNDHTDDDGK